MLKKFIATSAVAAAATFTLMGAPAHAVDDVQTSGDGSVLSGNQVVAEANVPVNVCGNSIAILGVSSANCYKSGAAVFN
ncbi:chaplin family protein [Lipingzhangella sp. LS1_29]|uniref:Chaplin family protein n=1 Tax=Lipingzhangella rawalii TaxID=2055835 RepID=A0ABU2H9H4_9ACTN|nr:chaplin family protein [Lipingzhangella rawalii]MDS1271923.1 chaplin family protein [Lipingzhangella rawalii]